MLHVGATVRSCRTAEGVERADDLRALTDMSCDVAQGLRTADGA